MPLSFSLLASPARSLLSVIPNNREGHLLQAVLTWECGSECCGSKLVSILSEKPLWDICGDGGPSLTRGLASIDGVGLPAECVLCEFI